ncbi:hypothetical protein [Microbacterium marinilacus]|nr:hypothetical protein [Microbacterium marinilacus]MBY0689518.1 hypothetical protein [Microbacterium marinilacus]
MTDDAAAAYAAARGEMIARLMAAAAQSAPRVPRRGEGRSADGDATVGVDERGFVEHVSFGRDIARLDATELAAATLEAIRAAQDDARGDAPAASPAAGGAVRRLHDDSFARTADELLRGAKGEGR